MRSHRGPSSPLQLFESSGVACSRAAPPPPPPPQPHALSPSRPTSHGRPPRRVHPPYGPQSQRFLLLADPARARLETHILFHAFLTSQNLPKTAKALVKELSSRTAGLGTEVEDESAKCSGSEMLALVKAKLDMAKEK